MAELQQFLDFAGLAEYDKLLKEYIKTSSTDEIENLSTVVSDLTDKDVELEAALKVLGQQNATAETTLASLKEASEEHKETLDTLNLALTTLNSDSSVPGSIDSKVKDAVSELIDGAPESLDTLKEIADILTQDEDGIVDLLSKVSDNSAAIADNAQAIKELSEKEIASIKDLEIMSLFPVLQSKDESAVDAINALADGQALKMNAEQEITDNLTINKSCYIDANGSTFLGTVSIPANVEVIIENATFVNPVVVI